MCYAERNLIRAESEDYDRQKRLYETMGDGACKLKNYTAAIGYYTKMLQAAEQNDETGKSLIPIYVSLYQTYKDNKEYALALDFMWREYELCKDVPTEAYSTLLGIAETNQLAGKEFWDIDRIYDRAHEEAKKLKSRRKRRQVFLEQIELREKHQMNTLATLMREELKTMDKEAGPTASLIDGESDDDEDGGDAPIDSAASEEINTTNIGDDIDLNELTDAENDEPEASTSAARSTVTPGRARTLRKRNTMAVKRNEKGESQLHRACISGNASIVRRLIDQGHPVNVRDNAGWLPLHEAANHGFKDIVELLLDNGATINDKGGTSCDGFTPLHDACGNGQLEIVELLLERAANATLRNDLGNTPLQTLEIWRKGVMLNPEEQSFYETVFQRLKQDLDKAGISSKDTPKKANVRNKSTTPRKRILSSSSSDNEDRQRIETVDSILEEAFPTNDPPENDSEELGSSSPEYDVNYREVMTDLRKGNFQHKIDSIRSSFQPVPKITRRPGMLEQSEVSVDDWLEDDVGPSKKKRRFGGGERTLSSDLSVPSTSRSADRVSLPYDVNISSTNDQNVIEINHNSDEENSADAFNILMSAGNSSGNLSLRRRKRSSSSSFSARTLQQQSSLIDNGFSRHIMDTPEPQQQSSVSSTVTSPHKANSFTAPATTSVKVKVEENLLNVPVNRSNAHELTIEWLAEEAAKRYYK